MKKILIANRGEIALRIMRSAKEMGIKTVAIYSDADRDSVFVKEADQAVNIGPSPSEESYLNGRKIIEVALKLRADAIHPGYGFLSENPQFAKAVAKSGITFIGPGYRAMEIMGNKLQAKAAVKKYDIPMIPGTENAVSDKIKALKIASKIGYPVLIKAAAGGGGKGMRIVEREMDFQGQLQRAISEARSAFGDGSVFIERYISSPRHIEIQILADQHGNIVHLFERECSIQRRHQKVIEEAPSSVLTEEVRSKMGACAVQVARACKYVGVGTVEFLVDGALNFYFLEMNTRLQVEHPVTEIITGLDLVKEQIKVARGQKLALKQGDIKMEGHAIEARIYAEDPMNNFLPDVGTLAVYRPPNGPGIRVDDGYEEGMEIPVFYDPLIAKLITFGQNRDEARKRMTNAIDDFEVSGISTTLEFCRFVMNHKAFASGKFDTHFVTDHFGQEVLWGKADDRIGAIAAAVALRKRKLSGNVIHSNTKRTNWQLRSSTD